MNKKPGQKYINAKAIKNWPKDERPREKLFKSGEQTLSNAELIAILLRNGTQGQSAVDLSREILSKFKTFYKKNTLKFDDLKDFIACNNPSNRHKRKETCKEKTPEGHWPKFSYVEIITRDKTSLDIFWLKDKSLTALDNLPDPDELATEIIKTSK